MNDKIVLYGATGYTGGLIARTAVKQGIPLIIAGRTEAKLKSLAAELGVGYRVFGLDDEKKMDAALVDAAVLLNTAGPFERSSPPLVDGCLRTQTHYIDIAGETPTFEALLKRDQEAQAADVMLMPGVGFGVVPTDSMAVYLKEQLPTATELTLVFETVGGVSQGTASTVFLDLHQSGHVRQNGRLVPAEPAEKSLTLHMGRGYKEAVLNPWRGDLSTAYHSTGIGNIETYAVFPAPVPGLMKAKPYLGWLWNSRPMQNLLGWVVKRLPAGPSEAELQAGYTAVWGRVHDADGQAAEALLHGPEAYLFTAYTAIGIAQEIVNGRFKKGFQTPAGCYGAEWITGIEGVRREDRKSRNELE